MIGFAISKSVFRTNNSIEFIGTPNPANLADSTRSLILELISTSFNKVCNLFTSIESSVNTLV